MYFVFVAVKYFTDYWKITCVVVFILSHHNPVKFLLIDQNPHELRNGHSWVSVVQLDGNLNIQESIADQYRVYEPRTCSSELACTNKPAVTYSTR